MPPDISPNKDYYLDLGLLVKVLFETNEASSTLELVIIELCYNLEIF